MKYKYLLFDLDGTITDSAKGVQKCFNYALSKFNLEVDDYKTLNDVVGPPLVESFVKYGLSHSDALIALDYYRERYNKYGIIEENKLYDGMDDLLIECKKAGYIISTATSKPEKYAKIILDHFGVSKYFDLIAGASFDESRSTKEQVLEYVLDSLNIENKEEVLLIGDTKFDLIGANFVGIDALAILFGYGTYEELKMYNNVGIIDTVDNLKKYLI